MRKTRRLIDEYQFPGVRPIAKIKGKFGDSNALVIPLERRQKKRYVASAEPVINIITIVKRPLLETSLAVQGEYIWRSTYAALPVVNVAK